MIFPEYALRFPMIRFANVALCASLFVGCAHDVDETSSPDASAEQESDGSVGGGPRSEAECQITQGLCWHWTLEEDGDQRVCVRGEGICGEVLHPVDPDAFPIMCHEGCTDTTEDGLSPWK
jgi:hypothetical protein